MSTLTLAIPSKGRLMEATAALLAKAGFTIERQGADRGYRGILNGLDGVEIAFLSASEIAQNLRDGKVDLGVTGQDLLHEVKDEAADLVVSYGGSISGEHGDGQSKAALLPKMYGQEMIEAFEEFKTIYMTDNGYRDVARKVDEFYAAQKGPTA